MTIASKLKVIYPESAHRSGDEIDVFIDIAKLWLSEKVWADKYETGAAYLTAHLMEVSRRRGAGGAITSDRTGDVAKSFSGTIDERELSTTGPGQTFLALRRTLVLTPITRSRRG
jgi:hypothetical protein